MDTSVDIRFLSEEDYPVCKKIYQDGLDTGIASFETIAPDWRTWDAKFLSEGRFVIEKEDEILGWIALTPFSEREVYKGVAEVSLYIAQSHLGRDLGYALLKYLIEMNSHMDFWTLQAKIFPQNKASIALFLKCGFRKVGIRKKIAMRDGKWYDNVLMEKRKQVL